MTLINTLWGIVVLVVLTTIVISQLSSPNSVVKPSHGPLPQASPTPELKDTRDLGKYATVRIDEPEIHEQSEWASRFRISQRYDNQQWVFPSVEPWTGGVGRVDEDPVPPLMPIDESHLIIAGGVTGVKAFLSPDKRSVYTEFKIRVDEILKNNESVKAGGTIMADREGGVVIYPQGQRVLYQLSNREVLTLRSNYLLFLAKNDMSPNYRIVASYEFVGKDLRPLETGRSDSDTKSLNKLKFMENLRSKITNE